MPAMAENIESLRSRLPVPCLGVVPYLAEANLLETGPNKIAEYFDGDVCKSLFN
jgi:hypothetical protein